MIKVTLHHSLVSLVWFGLWLNIHILNFIKSQGGKSAAGVQQDISNKQGGTP